MNIDKRFSLTNRPISYVPCRTPNCKNTPMNIELGIARAMLEYNLRDNPAATFSVTCEQCGRTSQFDYASLLEMIPVELRPKELPSDEKWAILLWEIDTADTMEDRGFLGERILVRLKSDEPAGWRGETLSDSQFASTLQQRAVVGGRVVNGFYVCEYLWVSGDKCALPLDSRVPQNSDIGTFFIPKTGNTYRLQCANIFCSNPSCGHIYGLIYSQLKEMLQESGTTAKNFGDDTQAYVISTCEKCGTSKVVDLASFNNLFKV